MNFAPDVNSGNYFNRQDRRSKRIEALEIYNYTPPDFAGTHFLKVGVGLTHTTFDGRSRSNTVRILRRDGTTSQQIDFVGDGMLVATRLNSLHSSKTSGASTIVSRWSMGFAGIATQSHTKTILRHGWRLPSVRYAMAAQ